MKALKPLLFSIPFIITSLIILTILEDLAYKLAFGYFLISVSCFCLYVCFSERKSGELKALIIPLGLSSSPLLSDIEELENYYKLLAVFGFWLLVLVTILTVIFCFILIKCHKW